MKFTVSNAFLMFSATASVRSGVFLKHVAMVLFMLCSAVFVEWLLLESYCVEMSGILSVW